MKYIALIALIFVLGISIPTVHAQSIEPQQKTYHGVIKEINKQSEYEQNITIEITNKDMKGLRVDTMLVSTTQTTNEYTVNDKVLLLSVLDKTSNTTSFYITDFDRSGALVWLFILFALVVLIVSKKWGLYSLIGMGYSFFIIFKFILPQLLNGYNPLLIAIIGALLISPVTFYLSHGVNKKTSVALISTITALFITGTLSMIFINLAKLTGFGTDEAFFLQIAKGGSVNIKGIYLAGIIIGTLGILDDVTISQASIVYQLKKSLNKISDVELYKKAMDIGHDHIASTVNTLVLVYTGAALPLLLLFINSSNTFSEAINAEIIADEIVRTLVGSIGLVLAVPISTLLSVLLINESDIDMVDDSHKHNH